MGRPGSGHRTDRSEESGPGRDGEYAARAATESMRPLAESAGVTLNCKGDATIVLADVTLLEQALLALVSNAIKHSTEGDEVTVQLDGATIFVEDQGGGIREDELHHVFERFYRVGDDSGRFGLGLSICKEIVESMDGEISIRSEENMGTTVQIRLPEAAGHD